MNFAFLLDVLISILLATTIVWCVLLNRRLRGLRQNQGELATLIAELNLATSRAESGISVLRDNAEQAGANLQTSIAHAERLNDDLAYLSERGSRLVDRLEGPTKRARQSTFSNRNKPNFDPPNFDPEEPDLDFARRDDQPEPAPEPEPRGGAAEFDERDDIIDIGRRSAAPENGRRSAAPENGRRSAAPDIAARAAPEMPGELNPERKDLERKLLDALKAAR